MVQPHLGWIIRNDHIISPTLAVCAQLTEVLHLPTLWRPLAICSCLVNGEPVEVLHRPRTIDSFEMHGVRPSKRCRLLLAPAATTTLARRRCCRCCRLGRKTADGGHVVCFKSLVCLHFTCGAVLVRSLVVGLTVLHV